MSSLANVVTVSEQLCIKTVPVFVHSCFENVTTLNKDNIILNNWALYVFPLTFALKFCLKFDFISR